MSDNKKYYYLKLKDDFFERPEIKVLESMQNGYKYSNLLLKLYLKSLRFEGALRLNEYIPYNTKMISAIVGMDVDTVKVAFDIFKQLKLIEILDSGTIYMLDIQNFIGKSSTEGDRKRAYRNKIDAEKNNQLLPEGQSVGQMSGQISDNPPPEIEKEIEIEIEIEKKKENKFDENSTEFQLSLHLYNLVNKNFNIKKPNLQTWATHIDKIIRIDGRSAEEVKRVIDWSQQDDFWKQNIRSTNKLRKHYAQLCMKMNTDKNFQYSKGIEKKSNSSSLNATSNYNYDINSLIEKMKSEV